MNKLIIKIYAAISSLVLVFSSFVLTNNNTVVKANELPSFDMDHFDSKRDFSWVNGENNWYYMSGSMESDYPGNFVNCNAIASYDQKYWKSPNNDYTLIADEKHIIGWWNVSPVRAWKAPASGSVTYSITTTLLDGSPAMTANILTSSELVESYSISSTNTKEYSFEVIEGDYLYFAITATNGDCANSCVNAQILINYTNITSQLEKVTSVENKIDSMPENLDVEDESLIKEIYDMVLALPYYQYCQIEQSKLDKLISANNKIPALKVEELINNIPKDITIDDEILINDIKQQYESLSEDAKLLVSNYNKIQNADSKIAVLKVEKMINDLPSTITLKEKDAILNAYNSYQVLKENEKEMVSNFDKLQQAFEQIKNIEKENAEIQESVKYVDLIPEEVTLNSEIAVLLAKASYENLTNEQKQIYPADKLEKLTSAIEKVSKLKEEKLKIENLNTLIESLPDGDKVTLANKEAVIRANTEYLSLLDSQKEQVLNYDKIQIALVRIDNIEKANVVINLIDSLPIAITINDKEQILSVERTYNALNEQAKECVDNYNKLVDCLNRLEELENSSNDSSTPSENTSETPSNGEENPNIETPRKGCKGISGNILFTLILVSSLLVLKKRKKV